MGAMEFWIPITLAAAFLQNLRSATQKHLKSVMGTTGATFVRFGFGLPFALLFIAALGAGNGHVLPSPNTRFLIWVAVAAFSQIAATFLLVHLFSYRNFAVGTAYSRTEPAQAALFALLFFGEKISLGSLAAIAISVFGVMLISVAHMHMSWRNLIMSVLARHALVGLASGAMFGISAVGYRGASLALGGAGFMMQAAYTLVCALTLQTLAMLAWLIWKEPGELIRIAKAWKPSLFTGFTGASASFGWFMALTLQQAAAVKALGQIEMLFTFAASVFYFREKISRIELAGCLLIVIGIMVLVLAG